MVSVAPAQQRTSVPIALYVISLGLLPILMRLLESNTTPQDSNPAIQPWIVPIAAGGLALANLLRNTRHIKFSLPGAIFLAAPALMAGTFASSDQWRMPLGMTLLFLPILFRWNQLLDVGQAGRLLRHCILAVCIAIVGATVVDPGKFLGPCRSDKCYIIPAVLGDSGLGNSIGTSLVMLFPLAEPPSTKVRKVLFYSLVFLIILFCGSRTAMLAFSVTLWVRHVASRTRRPLLRVGTCLAALALSLLPVLATFPPSAFTYRSALWMRAKSLIAEHSIFGQGPSFWVRQQATSDYIPNYSAHNLWLETAIEFGILGVSLLVASVLIGLRSANWPDYGVEFLACLLILGAFEAPILLGRLAFQPAPLLLFYLMLSALPTHEVTDLSYIESQPVRALEFLTPSKGGSSD